MYLPLIKDVTTAAGLVSCCITVEERFHYCGFTFVFAIVELISTLILIRRSHVTVKYTKEEKLMEFKVQKIGQKIACSTNSVSFGYNNTILCQDNPPRQNTPVSYSRLPYKLPFSFQSVFIFQNAEVFSKASTSVFIGNTKAIQPCRGHWMGAAVSPESTRIVEELSKL